MGRYLVVAVADGQGAGGFEDEDGGGDGGVRLVFGAAGDREDGALGEDDRALDLCLHVVRRDHGAEVANAVSRRLVFAAHRDGGQRQFVERPVPDVPDESPAPLPTWAQERLGEPLTVADLAARAAVSPATLHRRFRAQLGATPPAWLTGERVAPAYRLIERGEERLDVVAARSGLGTAANLRARVRRETGLSPSAYRRRFGAGGGERLVS